MKQQITTGIVLTRVDYGEADRILTILTPDQGKLRLMARGARKIKSKVAGGIELFSVSEINYMHGRGEIGTLLSAHLQTHYNGILTDIDRVQLGYKLINMLHRATEDQPEPEYFMLLMYSFTALADHQIATNLIDIWFQAQLLKIGGHTPNLHTEVNGHELQADKTYNFDYQQVAFFVSGEGKFTPDHIKLLRLFFGPNTPQAIIRVDQLESLFPQIAPLITILKTTYTKS